MLVVGGKMKIHLYLPSPQRESVWGNVPFCHYTIKFWPWAVTGCSNICFASVSGIFLMLYFKCCWNIQTAAARQGKGKHHRSLLWAAHTLQRAHFQGWTDIFSDFFLMQKAINYAASSHLISKSESHSSPDCFWFPVLAALCIPSLNTFLMENTQVTKCLDQGAIIFELQTNKQIKKSKIKCWLWRVN